MHNALCIVRYQMNPSLKTKFWAQNYVTIFRVFSVRQFKVIVNSIDSHGRKTKMADKQVILRVHYS